MSCWRVIRADRLGTPPPSSANRRGPLPDVVYMRLDCLLHGELGVLVNCIRRFRSNILHAVGDDFAFLFVALHRTPLHLGLQVDE
jgi:hypothetical protein